MTQNIDDRKSFERAKKNTRPTTNYIKNSVMAFGVGGSICLIAQLVTNMFLSWGLSESEASKMCIRDR